MEVKQASRPKIILPLSHRNMKHQASSADFILQRAPTISSYIRTQHGLIVLTELLLYIQVG